MALFEFESLIELSYADLLEAKRWWIQTFDCQEAPIPADWEGDNASDSGVMLMPPDAPVAMILLSEKAASDEEDSTVPVIFCNKLGKARDHLIGRGINVGPTQDGGDCQFFEIRDPEGHLIEISTEP